MPLEKFRDFRETGPWNQNEMAGGFPSLPLLIYSLLEENTKTNENIMRMADLLIFMMLDEHKKMYRNVAVRTDSYAERTVPRLPDSSFRQHFRHF